MILIKYNAWSSFKYLEKVNELRNWYKCYKDRFEDVGYLTALQKAKMCYLPTRMWGMYRSPCKNIIALQLKNEKWLMWDEEYQTWEEYRSRAYLPDHLKPLKFVKVKYFILDKLISMKIIKHKFKLWVGSL